MKEDVTGGAQVVQTLGNNGRLSIQRENLLNLTVTKEWAAGTTPADSVDVVLYAAGTCFNADGTEQKSGAWQVDTVTLNAANSWTHQWTNLPMKVTQGAYTYEYTNYFIAELNNAQYMATYHDEIGNTLSYQTIQVEDATTGTSSDVNAILATGGTVIIVNAQAYILPRTGGPGTLGYVLVGMTIMVTVCVFYLRSRLGQHAAKRGTKTET